MKKPLPGFAPINFNLAGKIIMGLGLIGLISGSWFAPYIRYISLAMLLLGTYLVFVVDKK